MTSRDFESRGSGNFARLRKRTRYKQKEKTYGGRHGRTDFATQRRIIADEKIVNPRSKEADMVLAAN